MQWVSEALPQEYCGQCVKLTTHLHQVQKLKTCVAIRPLPHTSSWYGAWAQGQLQVYWWLSPKWLEGKSIRLSKVRSKVIFEWSTVQFLSQRPDILPGGFMRHYWDPPYECWDCTLKMATSIPFFVMLSLWSTVTVLHLRMCTEINWEMGFGCWWTQWQSALFKWTRRSLSVSRTLDCIKFHTWGAK